MAEQRISDERLQRIQIYNEDQQLRALARDLLAARELLREEQWRWHECKGWICIACKQSNDAGCAPDCRLAALIGR